MSLTYTTLKSQVALYLKRDDLTTMIPSFITMGENEINRRLHVVQREILRSESLVSGDSSLTLTEGSLPVQNVISIWRTAEPTAGTGAAFELTPQSITQFLRRKESAAGPPNYFLIEGNATTNGTRTIFFERPADQAYTLRVVEEFAFVLEQYSTNWLSMWHEDCYLFASLVQAEPFMKNDKRIIIWRTMLEAVIQQIEDSDDLARSSGDITLTSEATGIGSASARYNINEG